MIESRELRAGAPAPNFCLTSAGGQEVELIAFRRRKPVLLAFFGSEVDEHRAKEFAAAYSAYQHEGVELLGIVNRPLEEVKALAERLAIPFPLLADPDGAVHQGYLGNDALGQVLLDRYNAMQVRESGSDATDFMPPLDALSWATFGEYSCSSTGIAKSSH